MAAEKKLEKYENEIILEVYCPFEKAHGVLKNVRDEFNARQSHGETGLLTVRDYARHLNQI